MEARACKKAMAAGNALQQQALLQLILSFVGSKENLFMSLVDSNWKEAYERVIALAKPCGRLQHEGNKCTSYAAAFASVPRLQLALLDRASLHRQAAISPQG
jgi:hypothetical protein